MGMPYLPGCHLSLFSRRRPILTTKKKGGGGGVILPSVPIFAKICLQCSSVTGNSGMSRFLKIVLPFVPISQVSGLAGMEWGKSMVVVASVHFHHHHQSGFHATWSTSGGGGGGGTHPQIWVGMCRKVKNGPGLRNELPVERENAGLRNELDEPF